MTKPANDPADKLVDLAVELDQQLRNHTPASSEVPKLKLKRDRVEDLSDDEVGELNEASEALAFLDQIRTDMGQLGSTVGSQLVTNSNLDDGCPPADESAVPHFGVPESDENASRAQTFGRFRLIEQIGQGGFARVFRAHDPLLNREVALKVPKPQALASEESKIRFEREAKAAAVLSHPAIVPVFESGSVGPISYIASAYCHGETLAGWFRNRDRKIDSQTAAQIVCRLADAVEHAHQRGIIHRDLKPANILVETRNPNDNSDQSEAVQEISTQLRITDFGLAKQIDSDDDSLTIEGAILGTPAYMSPEQAGGIGNVDVATDIYSLGVILFELLSSQLPFSKPTYLATLIAVENEPVPTLRKIDSSIPRDLQAICEKCLNKSPIDRYVSAFELSNDLAAYLENRPVTARPVSQFRKLSQWYARNTPLAAALTFAFVSLAVGFAVSTWQWNLKNFEASRADDQLVETKLAKDEALASVKNEKAANQQAQARLIQFKNGMGILTGIFEDVDIRAVEQSTEPLEAVLAKQLVSAGAKLNNESIGDPLLVADLQYQLASSLISLGFASDAIGLAEQSVAIRKELLTETHPDTMTSMNRLADAFREAGQLKKALPLYEKTLDLRTTKLGPDHPVTLVSTNNLARCYEMLGQLKKAVPLYELALMQKKLILGDNDPSTLTSMHNLASGYHAAGRRNKARLLFDETLQLRKSVLGEDHPDTFDSMNILALSLEMAGETEQALAMYEETLKRRKSKLGENHPSTLTSMSSLASGYRATGQLEKALPLYEKTLELRIGKLGKDHQDTIASMNNLGATYYRLKQLDKALPLMEKTCDVMREKLGEDHPSSMTTMNNLASVLFAAGRYEKAIPLFEDVLRLTEEKLTIDHPDTLIRMKNLAACCSEAGDYDKAIPQYETILRLTKEKLGPEDPATLRATAELGTYYLYDARPVAAVPLLEEAYAAADQIPALSGYRTTLRNAYAQANQSEKFSPIAMEDLIEYRKLPAGSSKRAGRLAGLGLDYLTLSDFENAKPLLEESLEIRQELAPDSWVTDNTRSMLGGALLGLREFEAAESLLVSGYEGMAEKAQSIRPDLRTLRIGQSLDRLLEFYNATDQPDKVEKYQSARTLLVEGA